MIAVIFEVSPADGQKAHYLDLAAALRTQLDAIDGFISIERLRIAHVVRDYGMNDRDQAPRDSRAAFSCKVPVDC